MKFKLNTSEWYWFRISDIFEIKRGKRLKSEDRENGDIPYYAASELNNALTDYISNPIFLEENALILTVFGDSFYVKGKFTCSDVVTILKNKNLNSNIGIFLATIISKLKYKYSYGRQAYFEKIKAEEIKIPAILDNNSKPIPDWKFMENYIISLRERERERVLSILKN